MKTVITAHNQHSINIPELMHYRELIFFLVIKEIKLRYRQTVLGIMWAVLQPSVAALVFSFILNFVIKSNTSLTREFPFIFVGMLFWMYFSNSFSLVVNSFTAHQSLVTKMYIPRYLLPFSMSLVPIIDFFVGFFVFMLVSLVLHPGKFQPTILLVPLLLIPLVLFVAALGSGLALLNARYRDVRYTIPFAMQILFFLTPIIYSASTDPYALILYINPLTALIESARFLSIARYNISLEGIFISTLSILSLSALSISLFTKHQSKIADYL